MLSGPVEDAAQAVGPRPIIVMSWIGVCMAVATAVRGEVPLPSHLCHQSASAAARRRPRWVVSPLAGRAGTERVPDSLLCWLFPAGVAAPRNAAAATQGQAQGGRSPRRAVARASANRTATLEALVH